MTEQSQLDNRDELVLAHFTSWLMLHKGLHIAKPVNERGGVTLYVCEESNASLIEQYLEYSKELENECRE